MHSSSSSVTVFTGWPQTTRYCRSTTVYDNGALKSFAGRRSTGRETPWRATVPHCDPGASYGCRLDELSG